jgi:hypothetical protein
LEHLFQPSFCLLITLSESDNLAFNDRTGDWKGQVVTQFKVLSRHLPGETEKVIHENFNEDPFPSDQYLKPLTPEYKSAV